MTALVNAAFLYAYKSVDAEILTQAENEGKDYGTAAVVALQIGSCMYVANTGDSRAVLSRCVQESISAVACILEREHIKYSMAQGSRKHQTPCVGQAA